MQVKFWGVRGSLTTPEAEYSEFGGNTPCVEILLRSGVSLALDAGMGLRWYNLHRMGRPQPNSEYHLLLTHFYWDHIQGLPFSPLVYIPGNIVHLYGAGVGEMTMRDHLLNQQRLDFCPVPNFLLDGVGADLILHELEAPSSFSIASASITWDWVPQGGERAVVGYRIEENGKVLTYLTDVHYADGPEACRSAIELARNADLLLHDGQRMVSEGADVGHSTYQDALRLAQVAGCKRVVFCHHDPHRDDSQIRAVESQAHRESALPIQAAREGELLEV